MVQIAPIYDWMFQKHFVYFLFGKFFLRALVAEIADKNNDVWIRDSSDILLYEI